MQLRSLLAEWKKEPLFLRLMDGVAAGKPFNAALSGLDGSARNFLMAGLFHHSRRFTLIVAPGAARAEKIYEDLLSYFPAGSVHLLPARELFLGTGVLALSAEQRRQRLFFLEYLNRGERGIFIAPVAALLTRAVPPERWSSLIIELRKGRRIHREALLKQLAELGYERVPLIEGKGQFSARGEIVDIFPPGWEQPLRLELFDDLVESLRLFNPATQRSVAGLAEARILPAYELILPPSDYRVGEERLRRELEAAVSRLLRRGERETAGRLKSEVEQHLVRLAQPGGLDVLSLYFPYFYGAGASLLDYLPENSMVLVDEPEEVLQQEEILRRELADHRADAFLQGELLPGQLEPLLSFKELLGGVNLPWLAFSVFPGVSGALRPAVEYRMEGKGVPAYYGRWDLFKSDLRQWLDGGFKVRILAGEPQRGEGIRQALREHGIFVAGSPGESSPDDAAVPACISIASLENGFVLPSLKLAVVAEHNLVPRRRKKRRLSRREGARISHYRELSPGDYVVHEQHGIGKYLGVVTQEIGGVQRDYLLVKYGGSDKLYIPVDQINLIEKYVGGDEKPPRLHRLGGGEWQRLKSRVRASVQELAGELLSLYAARQASAGYSFGPDHPWQLEFEARFPYEETPDQLQAIADVKADLEKPYPMDRLICGDVGYGKTEVALRAAFKVAMEGKQVALLVPTTVLAQQHYRTFRERFQDFPIRVEQLSRFVPSSQQRKVLAELAKGRIDIIIGTHRLLSNDVRFHDLGLLIIDEEHRFGVRHKEKLKQLRLDVDVLAMTATPIPRTLHLSLVGARDLSVIETPPENRYPVQTFVVEYSEELVKEAIQRELNRGGQVYFVFNRVEGINSVARRLRELFPGVPVAVGHGKMSEATLEQVMSDFLEGSYRILVSTTIIEAGLDIPNVNTLIVYDADRFGLAQLYQIRGRVGRSDRVAYAYLTYRKDKIISETARKRLQAIKDFTELGSGFKVALRDLEIRGAGNILGPEQHGFVAAVGFDLYCRLLEQAVAELKKRPLKKQPEPRLELPVNAYLPSSYITNQEQKIELYQRIYTLNEDWELKVLTEELRDRYGTPPEPVKNLLAVAALRVLSRELGVALLKVHGGTALIEFAPGAAPEQRLLGEAIEPYRGRVTLSAGKKIAIKLKVEDEPAAFLPRLADLLRLIRVRSAGVKTVLPLDAKGGNVT